MSAPDLGSGTTITFASSGYTANLRDINWSGASRPVIPTTHYTSTKVTKLPGDIEDDGTFEAEWEFDPALFQTSTNRMHERPKETITINFGGSGDKAVFSGFVSDLSAEFPNEDLMILRGTIQVDGAITWQS